MFPKWDQEKTVLVFSSKKKSQFIATLLGAPLPSFTLYNAYHGLYRYFDFYNHQRPHQALDYRTPAEVYADRAIILSPRDAEVLP